MMARKKDMWDGDAEFSFNISEEEFNKTWELILL